MRLTAAITQEDDLFVARCLETDVVSQGATLEDARQNLIEAVELHFEGEVIEPGEITPPPAIVPIEVDLPALEPPAQTIAG